MITLTAQQLLDIAIATDVPVIGMSLPDPGDASTWTFQPDDLSDAGRATVLQALLLALNPPAPIPVSSSRVSKTAFLGLLTPALYKAWATSTDPVLMYGKALFDADTTVDITNPAIAAVFAQAQALALIDPATAAAIEQAIAGLVK